MMRTEKGLKNFRSERYDLHITLITQFTCYWSEDTCTARLICLVQDHHSVVIKTDIRSVLTTQFVGGTNDHRFCYSSFFDTTCRKCIFYCNYDFIADAGITLAAVAQYADAKHLFGATVVRYVQSAFLLNHLT